MADTFPTDHWARRPVLVLDTETTGIDPETALVASISAGLMNLRTPQEAEILTNWIPVEMPAEAGAVNGLTTEFLAEKGSPAADVLEDFTELCARELGAGSPLVIANAPYDLTVLDRECRRNGVPTISDRLKLAERMGQTTVGGVGGLGPVIDPIVLDKRLVKFRRRVSATQGARQLRTLCQVHGVGWDDDLAHTSEYDARQAGAVLAALLVRFPLLRSHTLPDLHDSQVRWYADQSVSLRGYFAGEATKRRQLSAQAHRVGDGEAVGRYDAEALEWDAKAASVDTAWPIRPLIVPPVLAAEDEAWVEGAEHALRDGAHYDTACDDRPDCTIREHHAVEDL
jgi:DNA polymerase-3 subunit epsilon